MVTFCEVRHCLVPYIDAVSNTDDVHSAFEGGGRSADAKAFELRVLRCGKPSPLSPTKRGQPPHAKRLIPQCRSTKGTWPQWNPTVPRWPVEYHPEGQEAG